jgi:hypothetical protein
MFHTVANTVYVLSQTLLSIVNPCSLTILDIVQTIFSVPNFLAHLVKVGTTRGNNGGSEGVNHLES